MNKKFKNYINRYLNQNVKPHRFTYDTMNANPKNKTTQVLLFRIHSQISNAQMLTFNTVPLKMHTNEICLQVKQHFKSCC